MALVGPGAPPVGSKSSSKCLPLGEHGIRNPVSVPVAAAPSGPPGASPAGSKSSSNVSRWINMESNLAPGKSPWLWRAEAPPGASLLGRSPRASVNVESNLVSGKCPRGCSAPRPHPELPSWLEECNLEPGKCPRGFSARRPRPELLLLGQSPRASVSRWVNVEPNLEPGKCPRLRRPEAPCWVEVLEQVSSAGSICNLTWSPLSVPVALAPGGSGRRSSQREGYNEKMKNVTSMVGKWEKVSV